jgi:hypothetical protein
MTTPNYAFRLAIESSAGGCRNTSLRNLIHRMKTKDKINSPCIQGDKNDKF